VNPTVGLVTRSHGPTVTVIQVTVGTLT
jgi:hypothetical protein